MLFGRLSAVQGIYRVDLDGSDLTQLTAPPPEWGDNGAFALGTGIVFVRGDSYRHGEMIFRINVDGSGLTRLTSALTAISSPSPNGDFVIFRRDNDVYRLDLPNGVETRLTNTPKEYKSVGGVSPDGRQILFTRVDPGRFERIFVMNVDGTQVRRISRGNYYDFLPRWSPDGTRIAFTSSRDGTNGIYIMKADGSDVRDVSRTPLTLAMRPGISVMQVNESLWAWR